MKVETYLKDVPVDPASVQQWADAIREDYEKYHNATSKTTKGYNQATGAFDLDVVQSIPKLDHMKVDRLFAKMVRDLYRKFTDHRMIVEGIVVTQQQLDPSLRYSNYESANIRFEMKIRCEMCDEYISNRYYHNNSTGVPTYSLDVNTKSGKIDRGDQWGLVRHRTSALAEAAPTIDAKPMYIGYIIQPRVTKHFWIYPPGIQPPDEGTPRPSWVNGNHWVIWIKRESTSTGDHLEWAYHDRAGTTWNTPELAYAYGTVTFFNFASNTQQEWNFADPAVNAQMVASVSWEQALQDFVSSIHNTPHERTMDAINRIRDFKTKMEILDVAEEQLMERLSID